MKTKITILGLGQIGTSIGLGLNKHSTKYQRMGFDPDMRLAKLAKNISAIDETENKLNKAVAEADIIVMALAFEEAENILISISGELKENAIVLDTSPVREASLKWAEQNFSKNINYIGFTPMISPSFIEKLESGFDAATDELFRGGIFAISPNKYASSEAITVTTELAEFLNADIIFADSGEIDGLMATVHTLPQLISAGLMNSSGSQNSWKEGRKFAGRPFAVASSLIENQDSPGSIAKAAVLNKDNIVRVMNNFILEIQRLRDDIDQGSADDVKEILEEARARRRKWMSERISSNWTGENSPNFDLGESKRNWAGNLFGKTKKK